MQTLTTTQIKSLEDKIYDKLMENPEMGMGEMGECRDEASRIVDDWMEENSVHDMDEKLKELQDKMDTVYSTLTNWNKTGRYDNILQYLKPTI